MTVLCGIVEKNQRPMVTSIFLQKSEKKASSSYLFVGESNPGELALYGVCFWGGKNTEEFYVIIHYTYLDQKL